MKLLINSYIDVASIQIMTNPLILPYKLGRWRPHKRILQQNNREENNKRQIKMKISPINLKRLSYFPLLNPKYRRQSRYNPARLVSKSQLHLGACYIFALSILKNKMEGTSTTSPTQDFTTCPFKEASN